MNLHESLMQETCASFLGKFLDCVSPPLLALLCVVVAGNEAAALRFTQQQVDAGLVMYKYNDSAVTGDSWSWLSGNASLQQQQPQPHHWPSLQDQFHLSLTTAGADPVSHRSVSYWRPES